MKLVLFCHPSFETHQSMPRYAQMLADGMRNRGHQVEMWAPKARFRRISGIRQLTKWFGYIDQYVIFPIEVLFRIAKRSSDTLFVYTDQALGPWVPLTSHRPHVVHCHDFLAQHSALGKIIENPTSKTGQWYQAYIRWGYSKSRHFISVSHKTQKDLHNILPVDPELSEVVYNGLNQTFVPRSPSAARAELGKTLGLDLTNGYILHVGGNQWYKNRNGVVEIYDAWRSKGGAQLPLLMIGAKPLDVLVQLRQASIHKADIHFLHGVPDKGVQLAYAGASLLLFPSKAEGFGWPIAEAMVSGCPVITTNEPPMTEVAGDAAIFISRRTNSAGDALDSWKSEGVDAIEQILNLSEDSRRSLLEKMAINAGRFDTAKALAQIEAVYKSLIS